MRDKLAPKLGSRERFTATVGHFGKKRGWKGWEEKTILLTDVKDATGEVVADHLWFTVGVTFDWLRIGDIIEFDARVTTYQKGYSEDDSDNPWRTDYRLSRPTKVIRTHFYDEDSESLKEAVVGDEELGCPRRG